MWICYEANASEERMLMLSTPLPHLRISIPHTIIQSPREYALSPHELDGLTGIHGCT